MARKQGCTQARIQLASLALTSLAWAGLFPLTTLVHAAPTVSYKVVARPIPGFPGTGDRLGAGALVEGTAKVSGTEYGGSPPPLIGVRVWAPVGAVLHPQGFATCAPTALEQNGPASCPKRSIAGPKGSALGTVTFGGERVPETVSIQPFFAPGGGVTAFIDGTTPVLVEILATAHLLGSAPPFGPEFTGTIPLIETVPGALYASFQEGTISVGAAFRQGRRAVPYITLPRRCPRAGWPTKAEFDFLGGVTVEATYTISCPGK